jgi:EmrB/QacA subfamily drug resistance transporter
VSTTVDQPTSRSAPAPVANDPCPQRWRWLPVILTATFMALFDFFVVNVAAPSFEHDLHASQSALQLVVGGYAFSYATGLVTGGRLGDLFGYRRMFIGGMAGFSLASLLCGLAQNPTELVASRLAQGFTAAAMVPQVLALITAHFPPEERPRAMSYFGMVVGAGSVAGQVIGGLLLQANLFGTGWRSIFLVNVPIGAIAIVFARKLLPHTRAVSRPHLDFVGAFGVSASLALALVPLVLGRSEGWPPWTWVSLALSVPAMAAVLRWEQRVARAGAQPLVDLSLFRARSFSAGLAINSAFMAFFASFMLGLTLLLQTGLHLDPLQSGLTFGPLGVAFAASAMASNRLVGRYGPGVIRMGAIVSGVGVAMLLVEIWAMGTSITALELVPLMAVIGAGNGLAVPSLIGVVLSGVDATKAGAAAGVLTTGQQFSSAAGVAVLGVVFFNALGAHPDLANFTSAMIRLLAFDLFLIVAAMVLTTLLPQSAAARRLVFRPATPPATAALEAD